jgi:hypothetical protein
MIPIDQSQGCKIWKAFDAEECGFGQAIVLYYYIPIACGLFTATQKYGSVALRLPHPIPTREYLIMINFYVSEY